MKIKRFNFQELWRRKWDILEGYFNRHLNFWDRLRINRIKNKRLFICRQNECGLYDPDGSSENAFVRGVESCGGCGCVLEEKTSCLGCSCYLAEINKVPKWTAEKE